MLELIYQLYSYELKLILFVYIERFFQRQVDYIERKLELIRHLLYNEDDSSNYGSFGSLSR